jgi:signal transduction histidine kinase
LDLHGDVGAVEQVLTNLLTNARQHAFADSDRRSITITARREHDQIVLEVSDDGAGMDAATVQKIFEPFFTTRRNTGGSGLGLFLVYSLVSRKLGGTIEVDSQPGRGTRFVVRWAYIPAQGLR